MVTSLLKRLTVGTALTLAFAAPARATDAIEQAKTFRGLFLGALPEEARASRFTHFLPDPNLASAVDAGSLATAMSQTKGSSIDSLILFTDGNGATAPVDVDAILRKKPVTMVIVPGIFGEFIQVRPFEDVLEKDSAFKKDFEAKVQAALAANSKDARDLTYVSSKLSFENRELDQLVHVGSIDDSQGRPLVRVVMLYAPFASLETLGDNAKRAAMLNRRLEKYLALTGEQDVVLVGYSRGTSFALDMVAKAEKQKKPWLSKLRGLVAMNGVIWGSTTADQTADPNEKASKALQFMKSYVDELQPIDVLAGGGPRWIPAHLRPLNASQLAQIARNTAAHARFAANMLTLGVSGAPVGGGDDGLARSYMSVDFMGQAVLLQRFLDEMGLKDPRRFFGEYSDNIRRAKHLVRAALTGIDQLRTESRENWFKSNTLPTSVRYYAITSAMANPGDSPLSLEAFSNPITYAAGSFEDTYLLQNRNNYAKASGVALNDSQVAIPQASFLPKAILALNPRQKPLDTKFLGVLNSHHWGDVLRIVFPLRDGRVNAFPREALLKALAAQVSKDIQ